MYNIVFVCLGNICRSPLAEGFLGRQLARRGWSKSFNLDSAGTGNWHIGQPPDSRAVRAAGDFEVNISKLRARQFKMRDFSRFDLIIAMDRHNLDDLEQLGQHSSADFQLELFSNLLKQPDFTDVPDPYYGDFEGFVQVCELLDQACDELADGLSSNV